MNSWQVGRNIARGGFGSVYEAMEKDGSQFDHVVKLVPKAPGADRELLFADVKGQNVIPVVDRGEHDNYLVMIMPRADYSLREHLDANAGQLFMEKVIAVLVDVSEALASLEDNVVHRDIKPENVLYFKGKWCLSDFGIAKYAGATTSLDTHKYSMTPPYAAPEQWRGERANSATDIYALGVVSFEVIKGERPFPGPHIHDFRSQHLDKEPPSLVGLPASFQSLVVECLYKVPEARPTAANLAARLHRLRQPVSETFGLLQEANLQAVRQEGESARKESIERSVEEKRENLFQIAKSSLMHISDQLRLQISENASAARCSQTSQWICKLNNARLQYEPPIAVSTEHNKGDFKPAFDIIAHAKIEVRIPRSKYDYEGRAHSLWYCDAQEKGAYRWFETSFWSLRGTTFVQLFALVPGKDAYDALSPIITLMQVAYPFTPIDQGQEEDFIKRWIQWFGEAAVGRMQLPQTTPERNPAGSWRKS